MKKTVSVALPLFFLFVLAFPQISFQAACDGLILWYESLLPSLFPLMILSNLLLQTGLAYRAAKWISPPFTHFLGISPYGVYALLVGFLCGCPMGAKTLADMRAQNLISRREACYLVLFCNNVSPAFLLNYLVYGHLGSQKYALPTLLILYGSPVLFGLFANHRYRLGDKRQTLTETNKTPPTAVSVSVVDVCISDSIVNITKLGGYIVLFSLLIAAAKCLPLANPYLTAMLGGILEVSNGIHLMSGLSCPFTLKYLSLIAVSAFGGMCCMAQSAQMLKTIGIPLKTYLAGKISVTAIALLMAVCYIL